MIKSYISRFLLCVLMLAGAKTSFSKFDKTTTGNQENVEQVGGISKEEESKLNKDVQKQIQQFRQGRESSGVGGRGRYSGSLEMHDDYTGITYHPDASSGLEKPMDDVATKGQNGGEQQRQEALRKNTGNAGRCKDGYVTGSDGSKYSCKNLSPILVDKGPAHPHDPNTAEFDPHRVYELTDEAKDAATEAGKNYGKQVIYDATGKENDSETERALAEVGAESTFSENSQGQVTRTVKTQDGKSTTAVMGAQVDLLRSEYGWLEQQKKDYTERAWKTIRAARLAGISTERQGDDDVKSDMVEFIGLVSNDPNNDQAIAQRIQEYQEANLQTFCLDAGGNFVINKTDASGASPCATSNGNTNTPPTSSATNDPNQLNAQEQALFDKLKKKAEQNQRSISDKDLKDIVKGTNGGLTLSLSQAKRFEDTGGTNRLYQEARNNRGNLSADQQKQVEKDIGKIQNCLQRDVWCSGSDFEKDGKTAKKFEEAPDLSADYARDVREFMYTRYSQALEGPLERMGEAMTFQDFSEQTDAATASKSYADYIAQWKKAMGAAKTVIDVNKNYKENGVAYGANGVKKIRYKNNFNPRQFNPSKMSNTQLFGRDENRDATTLAGTGRGNAGYNGSIYGTIKKGQDKKTNLKAPQTNTVRTPTTNNLPSGSLAGADLPAL